MILVQGRLWEDIVGSMAPFYALFGTIYSITLCGYYLAGILSPGRQSKADYEEVVQERQSMPKRAHKNFRYDTPVYRFDHYCRWLDNCIGMKNHRSFFTMVAGFVGTSMIGAVMDMVLIVLVCIDQFNDNNSQGGESFVCTIVTTGHMFVSVGFGYMVYPILKCHIGLIGRNELAKEWMRDDNYYVDYSDGSKVWVLDLPEEEYDDYFDYFIYDPERNPYDNGKCRNWINFWFSCKCGDGESYSLWEMREDVAEKAEA